jgi:hypothetical protein
MAHCLRQIEMASHTVKQGEHLASIAAKYGFQNYQTIWNDGGNSALRANRPNPHVLMPGDVVQIPDKQDKNEKCATGKTHVFKLSRKQIKFRLVIRDFDNQPVPKLPCQLTLGGATYSLTSNGDGLVEQGIGSDAVDGVLKIPSMGIERAVHVGHLDPSQEDSGWAARLRNLGYWHEAEASDNTARQTNAVEEFQCDHGLNVTGILDSATKAKLEEMHGC